VTPMADYERVHRNQGASSNRCPLLKDLPKCLHCGAPHPTSTSQHVLVRELLCHLCGTMCSTQFVDQSDARKEEHLEVDCYSSSPILTMSDRGSNSNSNVTLDFSISNPISAMTCPPIYWIIFDGTCTSRLYWTVAAKALATTIESAPSHVHVGLLLAQKDTLSVLDLTSPACHIQNYNKGIETNTIPLIPVPVGLYKSHMLSALRAIGDMGTILANNNGGSNADSVMSLSVPISCILNALEGKLMGTNESATTKSAKYAGGRILCLLTDKGVMMDHPKVNDRGFGRGGVAGACAEVGLRYSTGDYESVDSITGTTSSTWDAEDPEIGAPPTSRLNKNSAQDSSSLDDASDLTPENLHIVFPNCLPGTEITWDALGQRCAHAALGVDLLVLAESNYAQIGLAILQPLAQRSGAPGPLLFNINEPTGLLESEILSRTPWHRTIAFGGLLRVRLSPGFEVDDTPPERARGKFPQLSPVYFHNGLYGAASPTNSKGLWQIGSCDDMSTMCFDIKVLDHKIQRVAPVYGMGDVALKPVCQVCFAYTAVVKDKDDDYVTVRRMRVTTVSMPLVATPESIFERIDPEALVVVLAHKMATEAFSQGLAETQDIGTQWLQSILVCAYKSAVAYEAFQKEQTERGISNGGNSHFYVTERLLNREGSSLTNEEILLGQGHERLKLIPLMVWALLQSDAFRPSFGSFRPSVDARCAAILQLSSMSPTVLAKSVAPRLELWDSTEAISEVDLALEKVTMHVLEHQQSDEPLFLFLDSPSVILVCDSRQLHASPNISKHSAVVGENLHHAINIACKSYRTPPPITYALDFSNSTNMLWKDFLVEDAVAFSSKSNFPAWKKEIARLVQEELFQQDS